MRLDSRIFFCSILYGLFISSGIIKTILSGSFVSFPVDITALFGLLCLFISITNFSNFNQTIVTYLTLMAWLLFSIIYLSSMLYTKSNVYVNSKVIGLIVNSIAVFIPLFFGIKLRAFNYTIFIVSIIGALSYLVLRSTLNHAEFVESYNALYLTSGLFLACSLIILYLNNESNLLIFTGVAVLFMLGARGPIIFFILVFSLVNTVNLTQFFREKKSLARHLSRIALPVLYLLLFLYFAYSNEYVYDFVERTIYRVSLLFQEDKGSSVTSRFDYISTALSMINKSPLFGQGLASFPIYHEGSDSRGYPHNLFLEIWSESGLFSLVFFLVFFVLSIIESSPKLRDKQFIVFIVVSLYCLLSVMKSYGFEDVKFLFGFILVFKWVGLYGYSSK